MPRKRIRAKASATFANERERGFAREREHDFARERQRAFARERRSARCPAAAARQPAAAASSPESSLTIDAVRARWREFVEAIGGTKRALAAFLEHGAPLEIDRGILVLGFAEGSAFPREQVEHAEHRALVERELSKLLGARVAVKTRLVRDRAARGSRDSSDANGETKSARAAGAATAAGAADGERTSGAGDASGLPSAFGARSQPILENPAVRRALEFFDAEVVSRGRAPSQKSSDLFGGDESPGDAVEGETA